MAEDSDFTRYVDARWADLVGGLEDDGVPAQDARLAVAETLLASHRSWERRVREEQVDVTIWAEARRRAGLDARPGEPVPHGVRPRRPGDGPEDWLDRASRLRSARRRRAAGRALACLVAASVLAVGWAWWAARPAPPEVRRETNPLPVTWYAEGELHLAEVIVRLPDVDAFVPWGTGAAVRLGSGEVVRVDADGGVHAVDAVPEALDDPVAPPELLELGRDDLLVQSVPVPGGGWAHLLDSSRRPAAEDAVRQSESGRRALVLCTAELTCGEPVTITQVDGSIRLR
ncbi:hypothetical protein [Nocardioides xinjiangensis]|uniref:hypothetical protein n=1 Tax=Nocardioides xinjiangensis TaxID=2817376 RepID=UPI001B3067D3|nr:hypothetical protein [Nocardioides sp. SYSU D00514]